MDGAELSSDIVEKAFPQFTEGFQVPDSRRQQAQQTRQKVREYSVCGKGETGHVHWVTAWKIGTEGSGWSRAAVALHSRQGKKKTGNAGLQGG